MSCQGSDTAGTGSKAAPFQSIKHAVAAAAGSPKPPTVLLRAGTYYTDTVHITAAHKGLQIQNFNGEAATVSGGVSTI